MNPLEAYQKPRRGDLLQIEGKTGGFEERTYKVVGGGKGARPIVDSQGRTIPVRDRVVAQEFKDGGLVGSPFGYAVGEDRAGRFRIVPPESSSEHGALNLDASSQSALNLVIRSGPGFDTAPLPACARGCNVVRSAVGECVCAATARLGRGQASRQVLSQR